MNKGVYDYFRNTTPFLSKRKNDNQTIFFKNIFSNHTHTSPSLISALSFQIDKSEDNNDIFSQKRISLFDFIKETSGIKIFSYENSSILYKTIFKETNNIKYSKNLLLKIKYLAKFMMIFI